MYLIQNGCITVIDEYHALARLRGYVVKDILGTRQGQHVENEGHRSKGHMQYFNTLSPSLSLSLSKVVSKLGLRINPNIGFKNHTCSVYGLQDCQVLPKMFFPNCVPDSMFV